MAEKTQGAGLGNMVPCVHQSRSCGKSPFQRGIVRARRTGYGERTCTEQFPIVETSIGAVVERHSSKQFRSFVR